MTGIPEFLGAMAVFLIIALSVMRVVRGSLPEAETIAFLASLSIIVAETLKTALKMAFGRTWPETWIYNNVSFIRDGVYGFMPFHGGPGGSAFPSGHTTAVCACMSVLWILLPRWRPLYVLAVAATALGLIGLNSHFLGDVIAGGYLGTAVGVMTVRIALPRR
jgi:membrane-associated phospholipid phosphatase